LPSSSFCPSSVFRESLGHSLFPGRPFCPFHPGLPRYPGILGLRAGAASRRSLFGRRSDGFLSAHRPAGGSSCYWRMSRDATPLGATAPPPRRLSSASPIHPPALSGHQSRAPGPSRGGGPSPDRLFADACKTMAPLRSWRSIIPIDLGSYVSVSDIMLQSIKPRELQRYINLQINRVQIAITSRIQYSLMALVHSLTATAQDLEALAAFNRSAL
jgi:hypothetical protein